MRKSQFEGATFEGAAKFDLTTFDDGVYFDGATFKGASYFEGATFNEAHFDKVEFGKVVHFKEAIFNEAYFCNATFSAVANFDSALFDGAAYFSGATFNNKADFYMSAFIKGGQFGGATFRDKAVFYKATFKGASFVNAIFSEHANFSKATFGEEATFNSAVFNEEVLFDKTIFEAHADFYYTKFRGGVTFSSAKFQDVAFHYAVFRKSAHFSETTFSEEADFSYSNFERAIFSWATFNGRGSFDSAIFNEKADFFKTNFNSSAGFRGATFKRATFVQTVFTDAVSLDSTTFMGRSLFAGPAPNEQENTQLEPIFKDVEVGFTGVQFDPLDAMSFRNADLRSMYLMDTDVRKIEFTSVQWPQKNGHTCVYDEIVYDKLLEVDLYKGRAAYELQSVGTAIISAWKQTVPWGRLERLYRELKQNYEDRKDYSQGGDFHYREKDMQRLRPGTHTGRWWLLTLYKVFGGYGERVRPPLVCCVVLFAVCAFFYMGHGLNIGNAALHSLQVSFLLRPGIPKTFGVLGQFVQTLQTILSPILLGLLALAIRQRVKR